MVDMPNDVQLFTFRIQVQENNLPNNLHVCVCVCVRARVGEGGYSLMVW
jgi:hypothetical protein